MLGVGNIKMDLLGYAHLYSKWPVLNRGEVRHLIVKQLLLKCYRLLSLHMYMCVHVDM